MDEGEDQPHHGNRRDDGGLGHREPGGRLPKKDRDERPKKEAQPVEDAPNRKWAEELERGVEGEPGSRLGEEPVAYRSIRREARAPDRAVVAPGPRIFRSRQRPWFWRRRLARSHPVG